MSFKEITAICPVGEEIFIHFQKNGKISRMYCWEDNVPIITNWETGSQYKITTKPTKNSLFVDIDMRIFRHIKHLLHFCVEDEEDCQKDSHFSNAVEKYKLDIII